MKMETSSESTAPGKTDQERHADFLASQEQELRSALQAITQSAELLEAKFGGDENVRRIRKAAHDLIDMVNRELPHPAEGPKAPAPEPSPAPCNVLYIEDDAINFAVVAHTLQLRPNVKVSHAVNGEAGLALALTENPKLILLDLNLPDIHGAEVLQRLQQNTVTAQIPVVVLSADATASQIERLLSAGARNYLTKPFDLKLFFAVIDEIFEEPARAA